ncbi:hypothetical protein EV182_004357 [Spiromyces aspiralis]|uniref:Uncharacterized protein n=1 Tax=Spiromyces aspiralis TaxID=68401 RepID=A0ACC1HBD6_9FUNG|nr:hypothetical protein EV182_004357 [Spiromyces aspiralis]
MPRHGVDNEGLRGEDVLGIEIRRVQIQFVDVDVPVVVEQLAQVVGRGPKVASVQIPAPPSPLLVVGMELEQNDSRAGAVVCVKERDIDTVDIVRTVELERRDELGVDLGDACEEVGGDFCAVYLAIAKLGCEPDVVV